jgi:hypothetical protein
MGENSVRDESVKDKRTRKGSPYILSDGATLSLIDWLVKEFINAISLWDCREFSLAWQLEIDPLGI